MRFLQRDKIQKTILVISDLHLGAGDFIDDRVNFLEAFYYDKELIDFLNYYSSKDYENREIELIINGDFLDFLAVPFVRYFDDEFWSEEASLERVKIIINAHKDVFTAINNFLKQRKKKIVYILGNHDAELLFESVRKELLEEFEEGVRERFEFIVDNTNEYIPYEGIVIKHGHEYEIAHSYDPIKSISTNEEGRKFFIPPWGSYYVIRVINKFKEERRYIDAVRSIKSFLVRGLIYDTLFTLRFIFHNIFYFIMVRFIYVIRENRGVGIKKMFSFLIRELELFQDYEKLTEDYLKKNDKVRALVVGHTHEPIFRSYPSGKIFINTGTWTDMHYLEFDRKTQGSSLNYANFIFLKINKMMKIWI